MHHIEEKGHAPKGREPVCNPATDMLENRKHYERRPERHHEIEQRRGILFAIDEGQERAKEVVLYAPRSRVPVKIGSPKEDEARDQGCACPEKEMAPGARIELEYWSQGVTHRHNTHPGYKGINDKELTLRPDMKQGRLVQKVPEPTEVSETLSTDTVEQIVPGDHRKPNRGDRPFGQVDKPGEHDHGSSNDPDDPGKEKCEIKGERPAEAHQRELDEDEPETAGQKKPAQLAGTSLATSIKVSRNTGEEDKGGCAKMCDPARQEQRRVGDITGIWAARAKEVAGMVKRHEHDGQAAQNIDAQDALSGCVL